MSAQRQHQEVRHDAVEAYLRAVAEEQGYRVDDAQTAALSRELEAMKTRVYEVQFEELKAQQLIPVSSEVNRGAETIAHEIMTEVGDAVLSTSGHTDDVPLADSFSEKQSRLVYDVKSAYRWEQHELWAAAFSGRNIRDRRAMACRRAIERKLDDVGATGIPGASLDGLTNADTNAGVPTVSAVNGSWDSASRTFAEIMADVEALVQGVHDNTSFIYPPDTLLLPANRFVLLGAKPIGTDGAMTVLDAMRSALRGLGINTIEPWIQLNAAGSGSSPRACAYRRSPDVLEWDIPLDFFQMPPEQRGMGFIINCMARAAPVEFYHPQAIAYMDNL